MYLLATGVAVSTHGFQSFPWWGWLLIGLIAGMLVHGKWGH